NGGERFGVPGSEVPIQLLKRVGRSARTAGIDPRRIRVGDEHPKRDTVCSAEAVQWMTAMRHISEDLLTPLPRFIWLDHPSLTYCDAPISTESGVVGWAAAGWTRKGEPDQPAAEVLEGLFRRLDHFARKQRRSN